MSTCVDLSLAFRFIESLYGSLAWWGFSSEMDLNRLDSFIRHARREVFFQMKYSLSEYWRHRLTPLFLKQ